MATKYNAQMEDSDGNVYLIKPDLLDTKEAMNANTTAGKAVDALVVKELNKNMTGINVYVGSDGKIHFKNSAGADTALPFSATPVFVAAATMVYSGSPSQRHNLTVTADMAKYKTLIIAALQSGSALTDVQIASGTGKIVNFQTAEIGAGEGQAIPCHVAHIVASGVTANSVISVVHAGTGAMKAIVYGL